MNTNIKIENMNLLPTNNILTPEYIAKMMLSQKETHNNISDINEITIDFQAQIGNIMINTIDCDTKEAFLNKNDAILENIYDYLVSEESEITLEHKISLLEDKQNKIEEELSKYENIVLGTVESKDGNEINTLSFDMSSAEIESKIEVEREKISREILDFQKKESLDSHSNITNELESLNNEDREIQKLIVKNVQEISNTPLQNDKERATIALYKDWLNEPNDNIMLIINQLLLTLDEKSIVRINIEKNLKLVEQSNQIKIEQEKLKKAQIEKEKQKQALRTKYAEFEKLQEEQKKLETKKTKVEEIPKENINKSISKLNDIKNKIEKYKLEIAATKKPQEKTGFDYKRDQNTPEKSNGKLSDEEFLESLTRGGKLFSNLNDPEVTSTKDIKQTNEEIIDKLTTVAKAGPLFQNLHDEEAIRMENEQKVESLEKATRITARKKAKKSLLEKIRTPKFAKAMSTAAKWIRKHKKAAILLTASLFVGASAIIGASTGYAESNQQSSIEQANELNENELNENELNENAIADQEDINNEKEEIVEPEETMLTFEEAKAKSIEDVLGGEGAYENIYDAAANKNIVYNLYESSWKKAEFDAYFHLTEEGTMEKLNEEEAKKVYEAGGKLYGRSDNEGTVIGFTIIEQEKEQSVDGLQK